MKYSLVVGFFLLFLPLIQKAQAINPDSLGSSVYAERRAALANRLPDETCAVIFSGSYQSSAPNLAVPAPFTPEADFYYLTGATYPNAVLVVFPKKMDTKDGQASDFLFLPGPNENPVKAMGLSYQGDFGKAGDSLLVRPVEQWKRFVIQVLDADQVEKIYTNPLDPRDYHFSIPEFALHPAKVMYGSMAPKFQINPEVAGFYKEIDEVRFSKVNPLIKKVLAWLKYNQEVADPILKDFARLQSESELKGLQQQIRDIKFDYSWAASNLPELRIIKSVEEREHLQKAGVIAARGMRAAIKQVKPGTLEREIQGIAEWETYRQGGSLAKATQVLSGFPGQNVLYAQNDQELVQGLVVIDLGVRYRGYCSQIARTLPVADTWSPSLAKIYEILAEEHRALISDCRSGQDLSAVVQKHRSILSEKLNPLVLVNGEERSGFRDTYLGGEISSIGLEINETPGLGTARAGMVLSGTTTIAIPRSKRFKKDYQGVHIRLTDIIEVGETSKWLTQGIPLGIKELEIVRTGE